MEQLKRRSLIAARGQRASKRTFGIQLTRRVSYNFLINQLLWGLEFERQGLVCAKAKGRRMFWLDATRGSHPNGNDRASVGCAIISLESMMIDKEHTSWDQAKHWLLPWYERERERERERIEIEIERKGRGRERLRLCNSTATTMPMASAILITRYHHS